MRLTKPIGPSAPSPQAGGTDGATLQPGTLSHWAIAAALLLSTGPKQTQLLVLTPATICSMMCELLRR
jgi:hypothetical protein